MECCGRPGAFPWINWLSKKTRSWLAFSPCARKRADNSLGIPRSQKEIRSMSATASQTCAVHPHGEGPRGRIFFLDIGAGRVLSANPDGSDLKTIVNEGRKLPDGLTVDIAAGHLYWTNMGNPKANDGSIVRSDLDGRNLTTIIAPGGTFTAKQLQIDKPNGKLYWCDREGMRVMRANLDGSNIETLVDTRRGDPLPGADPTEG